jgi:hypothetical protein
MGDDPLDARVPDEPGEHRDGESVGTARVRVGERDITTENEGHLERPGEPRRHGKDGRPVR